MKLLRAIAGAILGIVLTIAYFIFVKQVVGMPGTMSQMIIVGMLATPFGAVAGWHWPLVRKLI